MIALKVMAQIYNKESFCVLFADLSLIAHVPAYTFDKPANSNLTVKQWKEGRALHLYPSRHLRVFFENGAEASDDATLRQVRASYEDLGV